MRQARSAIAAALIALSCATAWAPEEPDPVVDEPNAPTEVVASVFGPSDGCLCWLRYTDPRGRRVVVRIRPTGTFLQICTTHELVLCKELP